MKAVIICPFDLDRLTGTPIRTKTTIRAISGCADVSIIATDGEIPGIKVFRTGKCGLSTFTRQALPILRSEKPNVIHGITTVSIIPMLLYKCLHPSTRLIFEMHGWAWFEQKKSGTFFTRASLLILDLFGLWFSHRVLTMSETQKVFLSRLTFRSSRIAVIWGPFEFDAVSTESHNDGIVVGYIGNSAWWQGLPQLIDAARILQSDGQISFRLAGFIADDRKQSPSLPNISYVGRVERADVMDFLRSCDVLVSSRLKEGVSDLQYPQKLSEYLGAGRPVIVSAANDQRVIVESAQCGVVVDPMTSENLAEAIRAFASMSRKTQLEWGMHALNFAKQHLVFDAFARKLQEVYRGVLW